MASWMAGLRFQKDPDVISLVYPNNGLLYIVNARNTEILKVSHVPQKKPSVKWRREFYDMVYLFDTSCVETNPFMLLNNLYGRVWELIDGVRTASDIVNEILHEFGDRARISIGINFTVTRRIIVRWMRFRNLQPNSA